MEGTNTSREVTESDVFSNQTEGNSAAAFNVTEEPGPAPNLLALAPELLHYKIGMGMHAYWLPVIVVVGLIGNLLAFIIMLKPHNRRISCCNYMAALAVSDSFMLVNALDYWTTSFPDRPLNNAECKGMAWLFQGASFMSMTFIFSMTVDRFIAIRFPFRARTLCTVHRTRIAIACIAVFTLLYTLPYLFTSGLIPNARTCLAVLTKDRLAVAYNWVNIFLGSIVPFVGLLSMNMLIIVTIRSRGKYFEEKANANAGAPKSGVNNKAFEDDQATTTTDFTDLATVSEGLEGTDNNNPSGNTEKIPKANAKSKKASVKGSRKGSRKGAGGKEDSSSRDNQLTVMLLLVTFTFLLLTLPQYARYVTSILWNYMGSPQSYADYILFAHTSNKLYYMNSACNFFLYCLSGTRFRQDFLSLFKCGK